MSYETLESDVLLMMDETRMVDKLNFSMSNENTALVAFISYKKCLR